MILLNQDLSPFLIAIIIAWGAWFFRMRAKHRADDRVRQLLEAAELLKSHADALGRFLDAPAPAPDADLKRLLIWFSHAMADRVIVEKLTEWSASRDFAQPMEETEETIQIQRSLNFLREHHPDLGDDFSTAIFTAASGACLRWPESAALFDRAFSRIATAPKRDLVIAIAAKNFHPEIPFSLRPALTA
jgi:hypothetical protein